MLTRGFLFVLCLALLTAAVRTGVASADQPATESVTLNFTKIKVEYQQAGNTGTAFLSGNLHLVSHVTLDGNGMVTDLRLHANLSDAFVQADLGAQNNGCIIVVCRSVGAVEQDYMPQLPDNPNGLRVNFPLVFRLTGPGNAGSENGIIAILIGLRLDSSGKIASAEIIGDTRGGCLVPCLVGP
jgi:hypothetical protein